MSGHSGSLLEVPLSVSATGKADSSSLICTHCREEADSRICLVYICLAGSVVTDAERR